MQINLSEESAKALAKLLEDILGKVDKLSSKSKKAMDDLLVSMSKMQQEYYDLLEDNIKDETERRIKAEELAYKAKETAFNKMNVLERAEFLKRQNRQKQAELEEQQAQIEKYKLITDAGLKLTEAQSKDRAAAIEKEKKLREEINENEIQAAKNIKAYEDGRYRSVKDRLKFSAKSASDKADALEEEAALAVADYNLKKEAGTATAEDAQATADKINAANAARLQANLLNKMNDTLSAMKNKLDSAVNDAMSIISRYQASIDARLQGSDKTFESITDLMEKNLAVSPYVSQKKMMENINKAVEAGISYNVEQRAFLESIKDNIATTFNAFDSNLLRLIRVQQADSTAARLGIEASLTKFLNSAFSDTSYLSDVYDSVSSALLDAESQMSKKQAAELEYITQKWLGSLYSVGLSQGAVSSIAQGIGLLGTGDVSALGGNDKLQTLMAMSASRAGISYADILTGGLTANTANELLKSMVGYLKEIAEGSDNNVVRRAYGNIFNLSMSDLRAISNLSVDDINNVFDSTLSYSQAMAELNSQFSQVSSRMSIQQKVDNIMDNVTYTLGKGIADSPFTYATWKMANMLESATGGTHLPAVSVFGNMVDLSSFTLEGIMKGSVLGLSAMGTLMSAMSSLLSGFGTDLSAWGGSEYTSRGKGFSGILSGVTSGTSYSGYVGSASSADMAGASLTSATASAEETSKITNKGVESEYTFEDFYKAVLIENKPITVVPPKNSKTMDDLYQLLVRLVGEGSVLDSYTISDLARDLKDTITNDGIKTYVTNSQTDVDTALGLLASRSIGGLF